jgi:hypothetical protein
MTFAQRRNDLTTHFLKRITLVKRRMTVIGGCVGSRPGADFCRTWKFLDPPGFRTPNRPTRIPAARPPTLCWLHNLLQHERGFIRLLRRYVYRHLLHAASNDGTIGWRNWRVSGSSWSQVERQLSDYCRWSAARVGGWYRGLSHLETNRPKAVSGSCQIK